jgi:hypothetical protein
LIRVFAGYDAREAVGWHAFQQSLIEKTSEPVSLTAIGGGQRDGSNAFTYSRFLVPYLCDFQGFALWVDGSDMLLRADLAELWATRCTWNAVSVVKHEYLTKHPRKYVGTELETDNVDYERKNWSSVILWDCGHYMNRCLTPEYVAKHDGAHLHRFAWLPDERIGVLPTQWNWLADEFGENENAKLLHWTAGIPGFYHYRDAPHADEWRDAVRASTRGAA